ncbi:MAG: hypothetical protein MHPSP_001772, partial [Paramarteilia canceri]
MDRFKRLTNKHGLSNPFKSKKSDRKVRIDENKVHINPEQDNNPQEYLRLTSTPITNTEPSSPNQGDNNFDNIDDLDGEHYQTAQNNAQSTEQSSYKFTPTKFKKQKKPNKKRYRRVLSNKDDEVKE